MSRSPLPVLSIGFQTDVTSSRTKGKPAIAVGAKQNLAFLLRWPRRGADGLSVSLLHGFPLRSDLCHRLQFVPDYCCDEAATINQVLSR